MTARSWRLLLLNNNDMAYDKKKIFEQAKKAIVENTLYFIEDIVAWLPCGRSWFYENFKEGMDEMDDIKELLEVNKIQTKTSIRAKLHKGDKAAELLALYRLICTPEERQNLNQSYIDHSTKGDKIENTTVIKWGDNEISV